MLAVEAANADSLARRKAPPSHEHSPPPLALGHTTGFERPDNEVLLDEDLGNRGWIEGTADVEVPVVSQPLAFCSSFLADSSPLVAISPRKRPETILSIPAVIPAIGPLAQTVAPSYSGVQTRGDHIDLLATKWLKPQDLVALVETDGLNLKKGKFLTGEQRLVQEAVQRYQEVCRFYDGSS
jgi:hypothetical protein